MGCAQQESSAVPTRPMEFDDWLGDVPRHFARDGDLMLSHLLTVLSSTFPGGEAYFVRSVEAVRGRITSEIAPAGPFYFAEDYHQQYLAKNPHGYCGIGGTGVTCPIGVGVGA